MLHRSRLLSRVYKFIWLHHVGAYGFEDKLDLYSIEDSFNAVKSGLKAASKEDRGQSNTFHVIRGSCYTSWLTECLLDSDSSHRFIHQPRSTVAGETQVLTEGLRGLKILLGPYL